MVGVQLCVLFDLVVIQLDINKFNIVFGSQFGGGGLFVEVVLFDGMVGSVLELQINVFNLINIVIFIVNDGNGVVVKGLDLLGIRIQVGVVELLLIVIGGVGSCVYNVQVWLMVDVDSNNLFVLGLLLSLFGMCLYLLLYVDVVNGMGILIGIQCGGSLFKVMIQVDLLVLCVCVGNVDFVQCFFRVNVCDVMLQDEQLLKLLG